MHTTCFDQTSINELKARLTWIQVLGSDKKVHLASENVTENANDDNIMNYNPVKAVSVLEFEDGQCKLLDLGFQYKGIGKTLIVRNIGAFNWNVLERTNEGCLKAKLTLFTVNNKSKVIPKSYVLKFDECPDDEHVSEDYIMIS